MARSIEPSPKSDNPRRLRFPDEDGMAEPIVTPRLTTDQAASEKARTVKHRLSQFSSSPWFWGVVAVVTTIIATSYVALFLVALVFAGIAISQARFFEHSTTTMRRWAGDAGLFLFAGLVLFVVWWGFRPTPQRPAATRADVHEEIGEAVKQFRQVSAPQTTAPPISTATATSSQPKPSPQPAKKLPSAAEIRRLRRKTALRALDLKDEKPE